MSKNKNISNSTRSKFRVEAGKLDGRPGLSYSLIRFGEGLALDLESEIGKAAFEQMLARLKSQRTLLPEVIRLVRGNNRLHLSCARKAKGRGG